MRPDRRPRFRRVFGLLGLAAVLAAMIRTWDRSEGTLLPPWWAFAIAGVLCLAGLVGAGQSWVSLFEQHRARRLRGGFFLSQLGKYLPGGGIWQAVGQVGLATADDLTAARAVSGFGIHSVVQLTAGLTVGGLLVFDPSLTPAWRLVSATALLAPLLLYRPLMARVIGWLARVFRLDANEVEPPPARALAGSFLWAMASVIGVGLAFAVLLRTLDPNANLAAATAAFSLAWAIGFAAIPFPSGLGVREAVLAGLLVAPTAQVLSASLALRLVTISSELVLVALTHRRSS